MALRNRTFKEEHPLGECGHLPGLRQLLRLPARQEVYSS